MRRALRLLVSAAGVLLLAASTFAGESSAKPATVPFYLIPATTKECRNVSHCRAVSGPWVAVPAHGDATFLFGCPMRRSFVVGGSDARASSAAVRVWFDGQLGAPIGTPRFSAKDGGVLLFHAATNNGRPGSFQPILGCVSLIDLSKRATVSARQASGVPGTAPGAPLDLHAEQVALGLATGVVKPKATLRCPTNEKLVGTWNAFAMGTAIPPSLAYAKAVTITTVIAGNKVHAAFALNRLFGTLAPQAWAQIGAMCEP